MHKQRLQKLNSERNKKNNYQFTCHYCKKPKTFYSYLICHCTRKVEPKELNETMSRDGFVDVHQDETIVCSNKNCISLMKFEFNMA